MMGVGKSTIGKKVAKKLKIKFVDIDTIIEKSEKSTIHQIFIDRGENYFRKVEKIITLEVIKKNNLVIALGGGAFINSSIRKAVVNSTISVWLDLSTKFLLKRLKNITKRPLLDQNNLEESINKIYSERKNIYSHSKFKIICDSLEKDQIVEKIIKLYENSRN